MVTGSADAHLRVDSSHPPDLTGGLDLENKCIMGRGSLSLVYLCSYAQSTKVAVKAIVFPPDFDPETKNEFVRKVKREIGLWRRFDHPNIVRFLGRACGKKFGSQYDCIVSTWMTNGTLDKYVQKHGAKLPLPDRIQLIKGSAAGLEYLHSQGIVHGDIHPANILIDDKHNACLTDFGLSKTLSRKSDQLAYLYTTSVRAGAVLWAAPELLYPELYPTLVSEATLKSDIYSLGSIILLILSGNYPWQNRGEADKMMMKFQNPPRPVWPVNMPDGAWNMIEKCWSPRDPGSRPSAKEVLSFCTDKLEKVLRPNINVVLFGAVGSGKSSIINLLSRRQIALESSGVEPCTARPRSYHVSVDQSQFTLWDTMGFSLAHQESNMHLLPYEHAHAVLQNLTNGVSLILLCVPKGEISSSIGRLYWLINNFFYDGRAQIAFVVTHFDTPDEEWWGRNLHDIAQRTSIPVQSLPHICVTTDPTGRDQSEHALKEFLQTYAAPVLPILLRPDLSSGGTAASNLIKHCGLCGHSEATSLVKVFARPLRSFNVVFCGATGAGRSSIINLVTGHPAAGTSPGAMSYTPSYRISTGIYQFHIWDTMGVNEVHVDHDVHTTTLQNTRQLTRHSSGEGRIDLLVLCMRFSGHILNELKVCRKTYSKWRSPVALVVTDFESQDPIKTWKINGKPFGKAIGGDVVGYTCIPSLTSYDADNVELDKRLVESRLSIEAMLEGCVSSRTRRNLAWRPGS